MRLEHKKDYTRITVSRANWNANFRYYREHYNDITPKRSAKQEKNSQIFQMLGDLKRFQQMCHRFNYILSLTPYTSATTRVEQDSTIRAVYEYLHNRMKEKK